MDRRRFLLASAATVAGLASSQSAWARRLGGTPVALVTADLEEHVAAVELASGRVVSRIRTLAGPRAVEAAGFSRAIVCHTTEGAVTILDSARLEVVRVLRGFSQPRYAAARPFPAGARGSPRPVAYVTDSGGGELVTLDLARGRVVHRTELGGPARHLSIHHDASAIWVALGNKAEQLAIVDTREPLAPRLAATIEPPYLAHDVVLSPDGRQAWVTAGEEHLVGIYDVATRTLRRRLPADAAPQHVAFSHESGRPYLASGDAGTLRTYTTTGTTLLRTTRIPAGSYNLAPSNGGVPRVFTPSLSQGTLTVLDASGRVLHETRVAASAHDTAFAVRA